MPRRRSKTDIDATRAKRAARRRKVEQVRQRLAQSQNWISGPKLADWYAQQRGSVTVEERAQLHAEACRSIFRSLLSGEFVIRGQYPHILHRDAVVRLGPEQAEYARGVFWEGQRDHAGGPVLGVDALREYISGVWLPITAVRTWLESANLRLPPWLGVPGNTGEAPAAPKQKRDVPRTDYRQADAPLVEEMRAMVTDGRAKNLTDAARVMAHRAPGTAKLGSKFVRLLRHARGLHVEPNTDNA